jgi:TRAP-type mannitol/chloroaromatic compound transport system permease small subunit
MNSLLSLARRIDWLSDRFGDIAKWAVLAACLISAGNAAVRYALNIGSNAMLEIQWYLFAGFVMFGAAQVLRLNEHVRVDVLYSAYPTRMKVYVDLFGLILFLLPVMSAIAWLSFPFLTKMYVSHEMSSNAGGLIRWPVMATIPFGLGLLILQALSEVIKRIGWLMHVHEMDTHYERPVQ